jgi:hypothetical protein
VTVKWSGRKRVAPAASTSSTIRWWCPCLIDRAMVCKQSIFNYMVKFFPQEKSTFSYKTMELHKHRIKPDDSGEDEITESNNVHKLPRSRFPG